MRDPWDAGSRKFLSNCGNFVHELNKMVVFNINVTSFMLKWWNKVNFVNFRVKSIIYWCKMSKLLIFLPDFIRKLLKILRSGRGRKQNFSISAAFPHTSEVYLLKVVNVWRMCVMCAKYECITRTLCSTRICLSVYCLISGAS